MRCAEPEGHAEAMRGLFRAAAGERLSHAILIRGPRGIGKFAAAVWLARGILCERLPSAADDDRWSPCDPSAPQGACPSCKKVDSGGAAGNHPDLLVIDPVEEGWNEIPVSAVAARGNDDGPCVGEFLKLASSEGRGRVVVVREAERLNLHAQNALLKTLEEPSAGTFLVLETSRPEALLDTIASRVLAVRLSRLDAAATRRVLERVALEDEELADRDLEALAVLADGAPGEARRLAISAGLETLSVFERWLGGGDALAASAAVWELDGRFDATTALGRDRERVRQTLDLLRELLAEAHRRAAVGGGPPAGDLARLADRLAQAGPGRLARALDAVLRARADVDLNLEPGGTLERGFLGVDAALGLSAHQPAATTRL
ncbi:MAG: hypothetical protein AAFZ65_07535 [Planctomycetota bacterium]